MKTYQAKLIATALLAAISSAAAALPAADTTAVAEFPRALPTNPAADAETGSRDWKSELRHGHVNFDDTTLHYPGLVMSMRRASQWYQDKLNHYDTAYVTSSPLKWKVMVKNNNWLDDYDCKPLDKTKFTFKCNATSSVGAYVSFSGLTVGYALGLDKLRGKKANSRKLELSFNCALFGIDFYHLTNRGAMTMTLHSDELGKWVFDDFTGFDRRSWGFSAYHYFNHRHYSQTAAYNCGKWQLRAAGSFMAGINITRQQFDLVADRVSQDFKEFFEEDGDVVEDETMFDYADYCLSAGYGYNLPLGKHWLMNTTLMLHPGYKRSHSRASSDGGHNFFCINGKANLAIAYNHSRVFVGVRGYLDSHFYNTGDYKFRSFLVDVTAIAGVRF